tara:strand:- start:334 stop:2397 length:2064 start_codon:yes stop_codon:yes gene_type:complete
MRIRMLLKIIRAFLRTLVSISLIFIAYISFSVRSEMGNIRQKLAETPSSPVYLDRYGNQIYYQDGFKRFEFKNSKTGIPELDIQREMSSKTLMLAAVAAEDKRFFSHGGVDGSAIARAFLANQKNKKIVEGASTITQQLARTAFKEVVGEEKTYIRKLREIFAAILIEKEMTKEEILENWYTWISFVPSNPGLLNASESLFSKKPWELKTHEIALIVGLAQSPTRYDPLTYINDANQRKENVLGRMLELNFISEKEYRENLNNEIKLKPLEKTFYATGFINSLKENSNIKISDYPLINTTLDKKLQNNAYASVCFFMEKLKGQKIDEELGGIEGVSLISIDPKTGAIRAFVTSQHEVAGKEKKANYENGDELDCLEDEKITSSGNWYDFSKSFRSPGSTIKPFIFTVALEDGMDLNQKIADKQTLFWNEDDSSIYAPENHDDEYLKISNWINAFANSSNVPFVALLDKVGNETMSEYWEKMKFKKPWGNYLSAALGSIEMNLLEITTLFSTLASYGEKRNFKFFESGATENGEILFKHKNSSQKIFEAQTAKKTIHILGEAIQNEKSTAAASIMCNGLETEIPKSAGECMQEWFPSTNKTIGPKKHVIFGKSGTSQNNRDGWYVGCIPDLCTGIWIGSKQGGGNLSGGSYPALMFNMFMRLSAPNLSWNTFESPNNFEFEPKNIFSN